jgi:hypothetical protein
MRRAGWPSRPLLFSGGLGALTIFAGALVSAAAGPSAGDEVLFDFETGDLSGWRASPGLDWQPTNTEGWGKRKPEGFQGRFFLAIGKERHEENTDGTLTSAPFRITRPYLKFLLAGELHPSVSVGLLVDGKVVRRAYGNNVYDLLERSFDVRPWRGKRGQIVIEDRAEGKSLLRVDDFRLSHTPAMPLGALRADRREETVLARPGAFALALDARAVGADDAVFEHSIVRGPDGRWHLYATVAPRKGKGLSPEERRLGPRRIVHATTRRLTDTPWRYEGVVMEADPGAGERFLWSPHVLHAEGQYHMFYVGNGEPWAGWRPCAPGERKAQPHIGDCGDQGPFDVFAATSADGRRWTRRGKLFSDTPFAFDPFVTRVGDDWVMYYAGAEPANILGKHAIVYRTSKDLRTWGERRVALLDATVTTPWAEHSFVRFPQLLRRGDDWFLLAGPMHNDNLSRYHCQHLFRADEPWRFDGGGSLGRLFVDAGGKVIEDGGRLFVSTSSTLGAAGGVWVAPLTWAERPVSASQVAGPRP